MKTLELEQTSPSFRKAARLKRGDVLVLTEKGKPVMAVVRVEDEFALEARALSENKEFMDYLDGIAERMKQGGTATLDQVSARFGMTPEPDKRQRTRKKSA